MALCRLKKKKKIVVTYWPKHECLLLPVFSACKMKTKSCVCCVFLENQKRKNEKLKKKLILSHFVNACWASFFQIVFICLVFLLSFSPALLYIFFFSKEKIGFFFEFGGTNFWLVKPGEMGKFAQFFAGIFAPRWSQE